jgi:hypothetical protein
MFDSRSILNQKPMKDPVEANLDDIVNATSLKLKELINRKQEALKINSHLKGQKNIIESDIAFNVKEIKDKESMLEKMVEELKGHQDEIQSIEKEIGLIMKNYNNKNDEFKNTVLSIDKDLENIKVSNGIEETVKKSELKQEYEKYLSIKNNNKNLMEELYNARRELYHIELVYKEAAEREIQRIHKTKRGIDAINKLYV